MKAEPKVTKEETWSWCPVPRGDQPKGTHARVPALHNENAEEGGKYDENRELSQRIIAAFREIKNGGREGGRLVLQWRMFPNAAYQGDGNSESCGCGCSCGCG